MPRKTSGKKQIREGHPAAGIRAGRDESADHGSALVFEDLSEETADHIRKQSRRLAIESDSPHVQDLKDGLWKELPLEGWRGLFFLALNRLHKRDPVLADILHEEAQALAKVWEAWTVCGDDQKSALVGLVKELERLEKRALSQGKLKPKPNYSIPKLLAIYEDLMVRLKSAKKSARDARGRKVALGKRFWRDHVDAILCSLGEPGRRTRVTDEVVEEIAEAAPSSGAMILIKQVFGRDPDYLRRKFVSIRKPIQ
jgi:hypothetical protein